MVGGKEEEGKVNKGKKRQRGEKTGVEGGGYGREKGGKREEETRGRKGEGTRKGEKQREGKKKWGQEETETNTTKYTRRNKK